MRRSIIAREAEPGIDIPNAKHIVASRRAGKTTDEEYYVDEIYRASARRESRVQSFESS